VDDLANGQAGRELRFLSEIGEACAFAERDFSGVGLAALGEDFEERRFAGAVGANQADAVAFVNAERNVSKEKRRAVGLGQSLSIQKERHRRV